MPDDQNPAQFVHDQQRSALKLEDRFSAVLAAPQDGAARARLAEALQGIATLLDPALLAAPAPTIDVPGRVANDLRQLQRQLGFPTEQRLQQLSGSLRSADPLAEDDLHLIGSIYGLVEDEALRGVFAMFGVS